jgi:hypothetical protein
VVQPSTAKRPSTALCLLVVLIGMGLLQTLARPSGARREKPGPTRGDLVLTEEALPAELAGWTMTKFIPAPPVDELPEGQYWWVHQWQYQKDGMTALVSFDQLGEDQWHELTYCYRGLHWVIDERIVRIDEEPIAPFVVAVLSKGNGDRAVLVFSIFYEDGTWASPPDVNLLSLNRNRQNHGVFGKTIDRFVAPITRSESQSGSTRALQCQVFAPSNSRAALAISEIDRCIQLHLITRQQFLQHWLNAQKQLLIEN